MTPSADESALILTKALESREPFWFIKLGDAAVECINGYGGKTCDGERYTEDLAYQLLASWTQLREGCDKLYVGDWSTASFSGPDDKTRHEREYRALMGARRGTMLHFECLLLMRVSQELLGFYRAVREDPRRKLLVGPAAWGPLTDLLRCRFLAVPVMPNLINLAPQIADELKRQDFDVMLYGAGMAGHVAAIDCWIKYPERTYVNLGSALDPACGRGKTRKQQLDPAKARAFFDRVVPRVTPVFRGWCVAGHAKPQRGCVLCDVDIVKTAGRGDALLKAHARVVENTSL